ncbi:hypothetical protein N9M41_06790 [Rhodopirellula sp.]|nr:hypothetical protein [Rhodopirellula sp.]
MELVVHRVNTIEHLRCIPQQMGVEVDLRAEGNRIVMNHDPFLGGCDFEEYLSEYSHGLLVLNIKEAGIEGRVTEMVQAAGVERYFMLDVEFPYIYQASRRGIRHIAMRFSEEESLETVLNYSNKVDWVWIDTNTRLPLDKKTVKALAPFKTCLVCPERWGRPDDISRYILQMRELSFLPDAVMSNSRYIEQWKRC